MTGDMEYDAHHSKWLWEMISLEPSALARYDALIERHMKEGYELMPLKKLFTNNAVVHGHRLSDRCKLYLGTHRMDPKVLVIATGDEAEAVGLHYSDARNTMWLGIKDVAAIHAILGNWLKKRDRRVATRDRRGTVSEGGRRFSADNVGNDLGGRRKNDHVEASAPPFTAHGRRKWDFAGHWVDRRKGASK